MIYLDNSATTRPCPEAVEAMTKALTENWGNPSALYDFGIRKSKEGWNSMGIPAFFSSILL